jgi:hypothetical protein
MTQNTYYNTKLGLKGPAWVAQIALGLVLVQGPLLNEVRQDV